MKFQTQIKDFISRICHLIGKIRCLGNGKTWNRKFHVPSIPNIFIGRHTSNVPDYSIIFFPCYTHTFCCGIAGIVSFKKKKKSEIHVDVAHLSDVLESIKTQHFEDCKRNDLSFKNHYLGGEELVKTFFQEVKALKCNSPVTMKALNIF